MGSTGTARQGAEGRWDQMVRPVAAAAPAMTLRRPKRRLFPMIGSLVLPRAFDPCEQVENKQSPRQAGMVARRLLAAAPPAFPAPEKPHPRPAPARHPP